MTVLELEVTFLSLKNLVCYSVKLENRFTIKTHVFLHLWQHVFQKNMFRKFDIFGTFFVTTFVLFKLIGFAAFHIMEK